MRTALTSSGLENFPATVLPIREPVPLSTLLHCPIRGPLNVSALAKDNLTATEEARRIDFLKFLLDRDYPDSHIAVETVIITSLGESGRNKLRCDVIVYDVPAYEIQYLPISERIKQALLVAEVKRDSNKREAAWRFQLEPAMRLLPGMRVMGAYWDDVNRLLFVKEIVKEELKICQDTLSNLPRWGDPYRRKLLAHHDLIPNQNLVSVLYGIADTMRSHSINDDHTRFKETVKLILARLCDEREAAASESRPLALQIYPDGDAGFLARVTEIYNVARRRYSRAKTLYGQGPVTELPEQALREIVRKIQGIDFRAASNETMQQVFMSFVPAVFKKPLGQYFTPINLIKTMVQMVRIGILDKIADPAMGTADFLTAAAENRALAGDTDILQRIYGMDKDPQAFDLAIINMILNKDGQSNLSCEDSIQHDGRLSEELGVVLCNPPFGVRTIETRQSVLRRYDLGHEWNKNIETGEWEKDNERILSQQQLGILFIERCIKLLADKGRLAIILPEGYLSTPSYGYIRYWLTQQLRIVALIELPRRIFLKSDVDLRSNILVGQKLSGATLASARESNYPIYADMVRKVGFRLGKGYRPIFVRDRDTGIEIRDERNELTPDTDLRRINAGFDTFTEQTRWERGRGRQPAPEGWSGATIQDVLNHPNLDLKPRRLMPRALANMRAIRAQRHIKLSEIADLVTETTDILSRDPSALWRLVAGEDIRAVEGIVLPSHPRRAWQVADLKQRNLYQLQRGDIVIGLVRPERRNIGLLLDSGNDIVGAPDGIGVIRIKPESLTKNRRGCTRLSQQCY
jgi:type I restriction enzyme M protein